MHLVPFKHFVAPSNAGTLNIRDYQIGGSVTDDGSNGWGEVGLLQFFAVIQDSRTRPAVLCCVSTLGRFYTGKIHTRPIFALDKRPTGRAAAPP